jgi:hypothetical protein
MVAPSHLESFISFQKVTAIQLLKSSNKSIQNTENRNILPFSLSATILDPLQLSISRSCFLSFPSSVGRSAGALAAPPPSEPSWSTCSPARRPPSRVSKTTWRTDYLAGHELDAPIRRIAETGLSSTIRRALRPDLQCDDRFGPEIDEGRGPRGGGGNRHQCGATTAGSPEECGASAPQPLSAA